MVSQRNIQDGPSIRVLPLLNSFLHRGRCISSPVKASQKWHLTFFKHTEYNYYNTKLEKTVIIVWTQTRDTASLFIVGIWKWWGGVFLSLSLSQVSTFCRGWMAVSGMMRPERSLVSVSLVMMEKTSYQWTWRQRHGSLQNHRLSSPNWNGMLTKLKWNWFRITSQWFTLSGWRSIWPMGGAFCWEQVESPDLM